MCKGKAILLRAWTGPEVFQEVEAPIFQDNRHMKVVRPALRTGRLYPQDIFLVLESELNQPQDHLIYVKKKVNQPRYRSGVAQRVRGSLGSQIS